MAATAVQHYQLHSLRAAPLIKQTGATKNSSWFWKAGWRHYRREGNRAIIYIYLIGLRTKQYGKVGRILS